MAFVDPERFKRFEQFLTRHLGVFVQAAEKAYSMKGPGILIYHAPDDRFDGSPREFKFQYKTKTEINTSHAEARDELLQGMLDRYQPPGEALFLAIYPDNTYDITRASVQRTEKPSQRPN